MNNHKIYEEIESGITYKVLEYTENNDKDYKYVNYFINKNENCKVILNNYKYYIPENCFYHPYYFPDILLSKTIYYKNGNIINEFIEEPDQTIIEKMQKSTKEM